MIHCQLNAVGSWDLVLKQGTPRDLRDLVPFTWLVLTPGWVDATNMNRSTLLGVSAWTGVALSHKKQGTGVTYSGAGLLWLLGDGRGKGPSNDQVTNLFDTLNFNAFWSTGTPDVQLFSTTGRVNGLTVGTAENFQGAFVLDNAHPTRESLDGSYVTQSATSVLDFYVSASGAASATYASNAAVFTQTPTVAITEAPSGPASGVKIWELASRMTYTEDWNEWCTGGHLTYGSAGTSYVTASRTHAYVDFGGTDPLYYEATDKDTGITSSPNATSAAQNLRDKNDLAQSIDIEIRAHRSMLAEAHIGDYLWVYDPDIGVLDNAHEAVIGGRTVNPAKHRLLSMEVPIMQGMGVYLADNDWGTIHDLTPYVEWETGSARVEVSDRVASRTLRKAVQGTNSELAGRTL